MCMKPEGSDLKSTGFVGAEVLYNDAVKSGAEFVFNLPAVQLVKDGDKVVGCICEADGKYVQYNAAKGVVLCTGDITAVDYPINVAGNSHGRCITYGYLLGKDLAK